MTFKPENLQKSDLNWGARFKGYVYDGTLAGGANDNIAAINTSGYFNAAANLLDPGDLIRVIATDGQYLCYVTSNTGDIDAGTAVVDVTDGMVITSTNTD